MDFCDIEVRTSHCLRSSWSSLFILNKGQVMQCACAQVMESLYRRTEREKGWPHFPHPVYRSVKMFLVVTLLFFFIWLFLRFVSFFCRNLSVMVCHQPPKYMWVIRTSSIFLLLTFSLSLSLWNYTNAIATWVDLVLLTWCWSFSLLFRWELVSLRCLMAVHWRYTVPVPG